MVFVVSVLGWGMVSAVEIESVKEGKQDIDDDIARAEEEVYGVIKEIDELNYDLVSIAKRRVLIKEKEEEKAKEIKEENLKLAELHIGIYEETEDKEWRESGYRERVYSLQSRNTLGDWFKLLLNSEGLGSLISNMRSYEVIVEKDIGSIREHADNIDGMLKEREKVKDLIESIDKMMGDLEGYVEDLSDLEEENLVITSDLEKKNKELDKKIKGLTIKSEELSKEIKRLEELEIKKKAEKKAKEKERLRKLAIEERNKLNNINKVIDPGDNEFVEVLDESDEEYVEEVFVEEVSDDIDEIIKRVASEYSLPESLIKGVIRVESNFSINAVNVNRNGTTDRGIMQLNSKTAPWLAKRIGIDYEEGVEFIPEYGIRMGALYLKDQWETNPDMEYVLTAYNRGPGGASKWFKERGTYKTTYSVKAMSYIRGYEGK